MPHGLSGTLELDRPAAAGTRHRMRSVGACAALFYVVFIARGAFRLEGRLTFTLFDDAMISMTYARNLARGDGLVWNAGGARVEGITNPLWTLVMAVPHLVGIPDRLVPLVIASIGGVLLVACAYLAHALVAEIAPDLPFAATAAAGLVAFCYPLVYWTLRGMEVGLVTALLLAGALLTVRATTAAATRRDVWVLAAVSAALVSTRLDAILFVGVFGLYLLWRLEPSRRLSVVAVVGTVSLAAVAVQGLARRAYYGDWMPNTYTLKLGDVPLADRITRGGLALVAVGLGSLAAVLLASAIAMRYRRSPGVILLVALFATAAGYSVLVGGDAWEWMDYANRYLAPGLAVLACVAAIGVCAWVDRVADLRRVSRAGGAALLGVVVVVGAGLLPNGHNIDAFSRSGVAALPLAAVPAAYLALRGHVLSRRVLAPAMIGALVIQLSFPPMLAWARDGGVHVGDDEAYARFGAALRAVTTDDATIAVVVAGQPIYFGDRTGLDLLGKSDPRIAALPVRDDLGFWPGHSKWDYDISIVGDRPDVVAQLWFPTARDLRRLEASEYVRVRFTDDIAERFGSDRVFYARRDSDALNFDLLTPATSDTRTST